VITGFNTDIEHDGVIYHVQTEDKGLDTPIILSLVYVGGAILASKRAPYEDLIAKGFSDEVLAERLKRQHRLICAAINSGRIEDLKKMSPRVEEPSPVIAEPISTPAEPSVSIEAEIIPEEAVEVEEVAAPQIIDSGFDLESNLGTAATTSRRTTPTTAGRGCCARGRGYPSARLSHWRTD
jgi:hypothetical protein